MVSGSEDLISKDKRKEAEFSKRLRSRVPEHVAEGKCEECGEPLRTLEEAVSHFDMDHPVPGDVVWVQE